MKIVLPKDNCVLCNGIAEVKNSFLYIYRAGAFKQVMYELTYLIYGSDECYYCHRKLDKEKAKNDSNYFSKITLDHLIPQTFGGPTIPNNMRPSCCGCNEAKEDMYPEEYEEFKKYYKAKDRVSKEELSKLKKQIEEKKKRRYYGEIPSLPKDWICEEEIRNIYINFCMMQPLGLTYEQLTRSYRKYKRLQKPVILSENRFLLDGFNICLFSKYEKEPVQVIVLENVIFRGFPEN